MMEIYKGKHKFQVRIDRNIERQTTEIRFYYYPKPPSEVYECWGYSLSDESLSELNAYEREAAIVHRSRVAAGQFLNHLSGRGYEI